MTEQYAWDRASRRYRNRATGRFLPLNTVARELERYIASSGTVMDDLTRRLQLGDLPLATWHEQMMREVKMVHLNASIVAHGGRAQMAPADYGLAGRIIRDQYGFLRTWAGQIESGTAPLDGRLISRARLYAQAANGTYATVRARDMRAAGFRFERNVLQPGENCAGCRAESSRGWVRIGELIPVGRRRPCLVNCRCVLRHSNSQTAKREAS